MRLNYGAILALSLVLTATACSGDGSEPVAGPSTPGTPAPSPSAPTPTLPPSTASSPSTSASQLSIVVAEGTGSTTTWTLTCDPVGGTHPQADQACTALEQHHSALAPVPEDRMCAQIYSGPQRATITGTWRGQPISAVLSRTDACETARWDALVPLVPSGGR